MRISDTVMIQIANEARRTAMVQAVTAEPSVAAVAASWPDVSTRHRAALAETRGAKATVVYKFVSPEYFSVLDIAVVQGGRSRRPSARRDCRVAHRFRNDCARPVAECRCDRSDRAPRPEPGVRSAACQRAAARSRERSRSSASCGTWPASASRPSESRRVRAGECRCRGPRSSRASTAIPNARCRRSSTG